MGSFMDSFSWVVSMLEHPRFAVKRKPVSAGSPMLRLRRAPVAQLDRAAASEATYYLKNQ